jgi:hypothetical protein
MTTNLRMARIFEAAAEGKSALVFRPSRQAEMRVLFATAMREHHERLPEGTVTSTARMQVRFANGGRIDFVFSDRDLRGRTADVIYDLGLTGWSREMFRVMGAEFV